MGMGLILIIQNQEGYNIFKYKIKYRGTIMANCLTVVPAATALAHSWIKSAAWIPIIWTPRISSVFLLKITYDWYLIIELQNNKI